LTMRVSNRALFTILRTALRKGLHYEPLPDALICLTSRRMCVNIDKTEGRVSIVIYGKQTVIIPYEKGYPRYDRITYIPPLKKGRKLEEAVRRLINRERDRSNGSV
jgi:hypothetical protein